MHFLMYDLNGLFLENVLAPPQAQLGKPVFRVDRIGGAEIGRHGKVSDCSATTGSLLWPQKIPDFGCDLTHSIY